MDFFKRFIKKLQGGDRKKLIENTVVVAIIGVIIIIVGSSFLSGGKQDKSTSGKTVTSATEAEDTSYKESGDEALEDRLIKILGQIDGVGRVDVMVTFSAGKENIPAYDIKKNESTTNEKDSGGGTREITQSDYESKMVFEDSQSGSKKPVIIKDLQPVIKGVVVVADGASKPEVKNRICRAVQVLMDIPIHKVQVIERKK